MNRRFFKRLESATQACLRRRLVSVDGVAGQGLFVDGDAQAGRVGQVRAAVPDGDAALEHLLFAPVEEGDVPSQSTG